MADILAVRDLVAGYAGAHVLFGVTFTLNEGRSLALLGRNGAGKTTLINSIIGLTTHYAGTVTLGGRNVTATQPEARAAAGIGWVPQERNIFRSLTTLENMTVIARPGPWTPQRVIQLFPRLGERLHHLGTQLSGGEQQMLAIGRALVLNPKVLLLDEPTEGLAPIIVQELLAGLKHLVQEEGMSAIIVEQHARKILKLTNDTLILDRGRIMHAGPSSAILDDPSILERHMSIAATH